MSNIDWLNRLAKWRSVFAGWQLGTRVKGDPEGDAVRDHREATLIAQATVQALCELLIRKGITTPQELSEIMQAEAKLCCEALELRFPGFTAVDNGMEADARVQQTMKGWKP